MGFAFRKTDLVTVEYGMEESKTESRKTTSRVQEKMAEPESVVYRSWLALALRANYACLFPSSGSVM